MKNLEALTHLFKGVATEREMSLLILEGTVLITPIILMFANHLKW